MLEGFVQKRIETSGAEINLRVAGDGPPLLCLHGYPQTHVMWHKIAPDLAKRFTVVLPDLRGYGDSSKPPAGDDHRGYGKREMAQDMVEVMESLGHRSFQLCGHDRGGRVSYRMALDHPQRVERLAILDVVPTWERFNKVNKKIGYDAYHWFFLSQPSPLPETLISNSAEFYLRYMLDALSHVPDSIAAEAFAEYLRCFSDPETVRATCDCYRASYFVDDADDAADLEKGRRIGCPTLILWGEGGMAEKKNLVDVWAARWADSPQGKGLPCGHFIPEEAPRECLAALLDFFRA